MAPRLTYHTTQAPDEDPLPLPLATHLGPGWSVPWTASISERQGGTPAAPSYATYRRGGWGLERVNRFTPDVAPNGTTIPDRGTFAPGSRTQAILRRSGPVGGPVHYERLLPDGSIEIFAKVVSGAAHTHYFLTEVRDPSGNALHITHDPDPSTVRILSITDASGEILALVYPEAVASLQPVALVDPYGRTAQLLYDTQGRLATVTDPVGIQSSFSYDSENRITTLQTPYGTTHFEHFATETGWGVQATLPDGSQERIEAANAPPGLAASDPTAPVVPSLALINDKLNQVTTLFWDRKAMAEAAKDGMAPGTPGFLNYAQVTTWASASGGFTSAPRAIKPPLENRIWMTYPNALGVANSYGPHGNSTPQTPLHTARLLPDGSSQIVQMAYNPVGKPSQSIDPLGRTTRFTYAANGIDLVRAVQIRPDGEDVLLQAAYNDRHRPTALTGPDGQTSTFTYNDQGQLLTTTNPTGQTTSLTYHPDGRIATIDGPLEGGGDTTSLTWHHGMPHTLTEPTGRVLTFTHDALDRPTRTDYPDGSFEETTWTHFDPTQFRDRQGRTSTRVFNPLRELIEETDPPRPHRPL